MLKKGSDKKIYLIQEYKTNIFFILKESSRKDNLNNEYNMLYQLKEILQLKYLEFIEGEALCYLIYDYKEGYDLEEFMNYHKEVHLSLMEDCFEKIIINLLEQIIKLHTHKYVIVHRDIKPQNIIIDFNYNIWIIDFSAAIMLNDIFINSLKVVEYGTIGYSAPEQCKNTLHDVRADIYGIGQTMKYLFPNILFKSKKRRKKCSQTLVKDASSTDVSELSTTVIISSSV